MNNYFCGWYFKCQSNAGTLAVIAARHRNNGPESCSVQLITDGGAWNATYPIGRFHHDKKTFETAVGECRLGSSGLVLSIHEPGIDAEGSVLFGPFTPVKGDIMGPFRLLPFMECRHSVISMSHTVNGSITLNGKLFVFDNSRGYIEGDRGRSFPGVYSWTHSFIPNGSVMLSVADIPVAGFHFTGVIGIVYLSGEEHRIATYLGAKAERIAGGELVIRQGGLRLTARLIERRAHFLNAPVRGAMIRTIRESASCRAYYEFVKDGKTLVSFESDRASFEYEYPG